MAPVVVIFRGSGIRVVDHETLVAALGDMFNHECARCQEQRFAARNGDRIKMRPIVEIAKEHQPGSRRPMQIGASLDVRE